MKNRIPRKSFRFVLSVSTLICWLLPIVIISTTAGFLLNRNYNRNLRRTTESNIRSAMWQMENRLNAAMEDANEVSYDGVIRDAYQAYLASSDSNALKAAVSEYLNMKFPRSLAYHALFISFLDESLGHISYSAVPGVSQSELLRCYCESAFPVVTEIAAQPEKGILFRSAGDHLFLTRKLLDSEAQPFGVLIMELEKAELLQSLYGLSTNQTLEVILDDIPLPMGISAEVTMDPSRTADLTYASELSGHTLVCNGQVIGLNIWTTVPVLRWFVLFVGALVVPMLLVIVWMFLRNINHPIETLIAATSRIQQGEHGYQIVEQAPNVEFAHLYHDFNAMSGTLKQQFDRIYEEQQALQQAKIKALQSQINPHFLNNTLEVINWEARLAGSDRVCSMLEALSTMLDAAIGRDGRSQVLLSEELKYVEAYLHITKQRLGDRLTIVRQVSPETLNCMVPLLMLQPILENAVEYDLSRSGGMLNLKTYLQDNNLHLEVVHDGNIGADGWQKIRAGLNIDPAARVDGRSVGIHNVVNRLNLLYGDRSRFDIRNLQTGRVLAEIVLPADRAPNSAKNQQC